MQFSVEQVLLLHCVNIIVLKCLERIQWYILLIGHYIYIETSNTKENQTAQIVSPALGRSGTYCVSFWYNMHGRGINTLNLYVKDGNYYGSPRWSMHGAQGNIWHHGQLQINAQKGNTVSYNNDTYWLIDWLYRSKNSNSRPRRCLY